MRQRFTFKRVQLVSYDFDTPDGLSLATVHGWANGGIFDTPGFQPAVTNDLSPWTVVKAEPEHCADKVARSWVTKPKGQGKGNAPATKRRSR